MIRNCLVSLIFTFFIIGATAVAAPISHILSGLVVDASGEPVPFAEIFVKKTAQGCNCDENGAYSLKLDSGEYIVEASATGYISVSQSVVVDGDTKCDFTLEENAVSLSTVNVYGKSAGRVLSEGALSLNAVELRENVNRLTNLNNIVNHSAGVKVRRQGGTGSDLDLSINGLSGNSIRYFIDGVPLDSKGSEVNLDNIPVNTVERVELYKGVVPTYLGADALGGAVNIVTKRSRRAFLDASYGVGSFHTHVADLMGQFFIPKTVIAVRPSFGFTSSKNDYKMKDVEVWSESDDRYVYADKKRFHDDYMSLMGQIDIGVNDTRWADAFFVSGSYTHIDKELQTGAMQNKVYGMAERNSHAWSVSARYAKDWGRVNTRLNFSHTWDHSETVDTAFRKYSWDGTWLPSSGNELNNKAKTVRVYSRPLTLLSAGADYDFAAGHTIGINYMLNRRGNRRYDEVDASFEPTNDAVTKHILSLTYSQSFFNERWQNMFFVKDYINATSIEQNDNVSITGADDIERNATKNYWGGGVGSRFTFNPILSVKGSYEHSVRLPLSRELLGNGTTVYPNLALRPEVSNNYNLGLFGTWRIDGDNVFSYGITGFIRHVRNYIRATVSEREGMMQYANEPAIDIKGFDVDLGYTWREALHVSLNGSWNDARDLKRYKTDGNPSATYKNRVPNRPWMYANAEASYTFNKLSRLRDRLRIEGSFEWIHWYYLNWEAYGAVASKAKIPTQKITSLSATYSWIDGRYNLSAECTNLFDRLAYDNYMLQKPGRAFYVKFRVFID